MSYDKVTPLELAHQHADGGMPPEYPQEVAVAQPETSLPETGAIEQAKQVQENNKEYNLRVMRERAEAAERRAQELERAIRQQQPVQQQSAPIQTPELDIDDDSIIEGKHLKKYIKSLKQEIDQTRQQVQEYKQQSSSFAAEARLKAQHSDLDQVVSEENLKNFAAIYPDDFNAMMSHPDMYARAKIAYSMIKNKGLASSSYKDNERRLEENKTKPRSAAVASPQQGETPLTKVSDFDRRTLSEDRKEMLRQQVLEAKKFR